MTTLLYCARCGRETVAIRSKTAANYEMDCCASCEYEMASERFSALVLALRNIVNALGPEEICSCPAADGCGLREEASDALTTARQALEGEEA